MTEEIKGLNLRFYELFGDYHENRELIPAKQRDYITARLFDLYKEEYARMYARCEIQKKQEIFRTKARRALYIPRPWHWYTFWRRANKAAKLFRKEVAAEAGKFFSERQKKLLAESAQKEPEKEESEKAQVPETGDKGAPIGADPKSENPQNGGQGNVANDGGQKSKSKTGVAFLSDQRRKNALP